MPNALPTAAWTDDQIRERLAEVVARSLRIDPARVTPAVTFPELGAESLDLVEITLDVELAFGILWPEHHVLEIANEELGDAAVAGAGGVVTATGLALLRDRLPVSAFSTLPATPLVADVTTLFLRVDVWMHVIRMLLEAAPRTCTSCGGPLVLGTPARVACPSCHTERDLQPGDEVNRAWIREWRGSH